MYAEFEAALRSFWKSPQGMRRRTDPNVHLLIDSIGARRNIDSTTIAGAHDVREYRNDLLHSGAPGLTLTLQECRSLLCRFSSFLPLQW